MYEVVVSLSRHNKDGIVAMNRLKFLLLFVLILSSINCNRKSGEQLYYLIAKCDLPKTVLAESVQGRPICSYDMGTGDSTLVIFGGFHGDEILGVEFVQKFAEYLSREGQHEFAAHVIIIPVLNPDGLIMNTRVNANGVDVNRNFPTGNWSRSYDSDDNYPGESPASEPETRAVIALLDKVRPQRIITVHTPLKVVNYDGPGRELASSMAQFNGYPFADDIGYPTPGSFGTFAGKEKQIPVITLELPKATLEEIWEPNRKALMQALEF